MADAPRYAIGDLADLGGVSRRTVRYYVQEGLLPAPHGIGRGNHYGPEHLNQLLKVKSLQEAGRTLDQVRRELTQRSRSRASQPLPSTAGQPLPRSLWRRVTVAPGVELNVAGNVRLPSPGRLEQLAAWCRQHFIVADTDEDTDA
jgi:DNA-binding transcriptional MerR regulator